MTRVLRIGPREADLLADALLTLQAEWEVWDPPPPRADIRRAQRLHRKLYQLWKQGGNA